MPQMIPATSPANKTKNNPFQNGSSLSINPNRSGKSQTQKLYNPSRIFWAGMG